MRALRIGPIEVPAPVVLAPMAGVTNAAFRVLCREQGPGLFVAEMLGARSLVDGHEMTRRLASFDPDESPRSLQLYGVRPRDLREAVAMLVGEGAVDHIDLNFGCPVPKVTRHGGGAALPWRLDLYRDLVRAAVRAAGEVPVTVKFRMGIDAEHLTYLDAGRIAEAEGAAAVTLHARTAYQLYGGSADWSAIARLREAVTSIPVLGNGDIWEAADAVAMMEETGCDGVVIGRGCLGRPWLFRDLGAVFSGRPVPPPPSLGEVADMMSRHVGLLATRYGERYAVHTFRRHVAWYLQGFEVGRGLRNRLTGAPSVEALVAAIAELPRDVPFPVHVLRTPRGHTHGPRPVRLPHGFLDSRVGGPPVDAAAVAASGG